MRKPRGQIDQLNGYFHIENSLRPELPHFTKMDAEAHYARMLEVAEANCLRVVFWHFYPTGFGLLVHKEKTTSRFAKDRQRITEFVKVLKQQMTVAYNREHVRSGTIWRDRSKLFHIPDNEGDRFEVAAYIMARPKIETGQACLDWPSSYHAAENGNSPARQNIAELLGRKQYSPALLGKLESLRLLMLKQFPEPQTGTKRGPTPEKRPTCESGSNANSSVKPPTSGSYQAQRQRGNERFFKMLSRYIDFCKRTGFARLPRGYKEEPELRRWAASLRGKDRYGRLPEWKRKALKDTTVLDPLHSTTGDPAPPSDAWLEQFHALQAFHLQHGHCRVKRTDPLRKTLANWVWTQRGIARKKNLHPEKRRLLDTLGFDWNPRK